MTKEEQEKADELIRRGDAVLMIQRHGIGCYDPDEFSPEQCERYVINMINKIPKAE